MRSRLAEASADLVTKMDPAYLAALTVTVLPGHSMPLHAASPSAMRDKLTTLLRHLRT